MNTVQINNDDRAALKTALSDFKRNSIEMIDFDRLEELLGRLHDRLDSDKNLAAELDMIKDDYRKRIVGMLKAIIVCRPDKEDDRTAACLAGDIGDIDTGELVRLYPRVAARFRQCFPGSFRYMGQSSAVTPNNDWMDHKI